MSMQGKHVGLIEVNKNRGKSLDFLVLLALSTGGAVAVILEATVDNN